MDWEDLRDRTLVGVAHDADDGEVNKAWRKKAAALHPDRQQDPAKKLAAELQLKELNAARQRVLDRRDTPPTAPAAPRDPRASARATATPYRKREAEAIAHAINFAVRNPEAVLVGVGVWAGLKILETLFRPGRH